MPIYVDPGMPGRDVRRRTAEELCRLFNEANPVGSKVRVWTMVRGEGPGTETEVSEPGAYVNSAGYAVLKVPGDSIALTHVEVVT